MSCWIDTHCHLDAPEFAADARAVRRRAADEGVAVCVIAAVQAPDFEACRALAHGLGDAYALGIHPMAVERAPDGALARLDRALAQYAADPRLVAVGEIGLDYFVDNLCQEPLNQRQQLFFREQLKLARKHGLPVIVHLRRAADRVLKGLRDIAVPGGIAHAFNGSRQQAGLFLNLGFKLGFGGAVTYPRATRLRALAAELPPEAIVMETDAPDMPPRWLYADAGQRARGQPQGRNEPGELPRIGAEVAALRNLPPGQWAAQTSANALAALPKLAAIWAERGQMAR
ncbi:MAG: TatD family hydrolase [Desulfovibrionaceae bacterium]|jgi:TatD DNase family protein|nr:TatD family hydrolase [Desulfovibrionaceae bacterium]